MPKSTPWGQSDYEKQYAEGIVFYGTPSHGGFKLGRKRNAKMPDYLRRPGGWYEGDCEWSLVALVYPEAFTPENVESAHSTAWNWYPDEYERFTGAKLDPQSSYVLRERQFKVETADKLVTLAAWGDWHDSVPKGMVGVVASIGGSRDQERGKRYFIVPNSEYRKHSQFGFIVDPARHQECQPIR